jgi:predicted small secreted protein
MKKTLMLAILVALSMLSTGCATWDAVKQDSGNAWDSTKDAVHEATK